MPIPPASNMVTPLEPPEVRNDALETNVQSKEIPGIYNLQNDSNTTSIDGKVFTPVKITHFRKSIKESIHHHGTKDSVSRDSSEIPSNVSYMMDTMYPKPSGIFAPIKSKSTLMRVLMEVLQLPADYIGALDACGYNKPSIIVNKFGCEDKGRVKAFGTLGKRFVLDECNHDHALNLFLFCRSQSCNYQIFPRGKRIKHLEDPSTYERVFEQQDMLNLQQIKDFVYKPNNQSIGRTIMRNIRKKIRKSLKPTHQWESATLHTKEVPWTPRVTMVPNSLRKFTTPGVIETTINASPTPPTIIHNQLLDMETQWKAIKDSMTLTLDTKLNDITARFASLETTIEDTVAKEIDKKTSSSIDQRAKQAISKQLHSTFKKTQHKQDSEDEFSMSDHNGYPPPKRTYYKYSSSPESSDNETISSLPSPVWKEKHIPGQPRTDHLISPFDPKFYAGCNDDCFSLTTTSESRTSSQKKKKQKTRDWMRKQS